jgi:lactoylglutathione lyase
MPSKPKLRYAILYVENLERALSFYTEVIGFRQRRRIGPYAELDTGSTLLGLSERAFVAKELLEEELPKPGQGSCEIGIVVPEAEVQVLYERALAAGCEAIKPPCRQPWGQITSWVRDPDGHVLELCSPTE